MLEPEKTVKKRHVAKTSGKLIHAGLNADPILSICYAVPSFSTSAHLRLMKVSFGGRVFSSGSALVSGPQMIYEAGQCPTLDECSLVN